MAMLTQREAIGHTSTSGDGDIDYRGKIAKQAALTAEQRQRDHDQQISEHNTPAARIKIWERLHQMVLPPDGNHRVLKDIAAKTGLSMEEIRAEQQERKVNGRIA